MTSSLTKLAARYWELSKDLNGWDSADDYKFDPPGKIDLGRESGLEHLADAGLAADLSLSDDCLLLSVGVPLNGPDAVDVYAWAAVKMELVVFGALHLQDGDPDGLRAIAAIFTKYAEMAEEAAQAHERGERLTSPPAQ